jgi:raffinose/stachyose/melibiose transport system substrate-binding protein
MKSLSIRLLLLATILMVATTAFATAPVEEEEGVTFSWWALSGGGGSPNPRETMRQAIIADFEAENPGVTVELQMWENEAFKQKVQIDVQAGNPPDLFHSWGGGVMVEYAQAGQLLDITDTVENVLSQTIGMGPLGVYGYEGHYYGAPYDMGAVGMWYNTDIFDEVGVSVPQTWPQLLDVVEQIGNAGYVPIAVGGGDRWPAHFWWTYLASRIGGEPAFNAAYSGAGSFADEPFVEAGEALLDLLALDPFQEGFLGATYDDESALVADGVAAMELMGQWAPAVQQANSSDGIGLGDSLGWFPFPSVPGGAGSRSDVMGGGNGYVVGANAPDAAVDFLVYFLQPEYAPAIIDAEGIVPVVSDVDWDFDANALAIMDAVANADYYQLYYDQFLPPAVGEAVKDAVVALLAGQATPEECAQMLQDAWEMEQ